MATKKPIISGEVFGRLTVICEAPKRHGNPHRRVTARCNCGVVGDYEMFQLRSGHTQSCGCRDSERRTTHGHAKNNSRTYRSWAAMKSRCRTDRLVECYSAKGVTLCERWRSFEMFLADMGERPEGMTIDRIDPNGNYEPGNCRWATPFQQAINRTNSHRLTAFGRTMTIMEWSKETNIPFQTIRHRILRGWNDERAVSK